MSNKAQLVSVLSTTTKPSIKAEKKPTSQGGEVIALGPYMWGGLANKAVPGAVSIDDFIAKHSSNPRFAAALKTGRSWVADEFYSGEKSLRTLRLHKGWSQTELAERAGMKQPYIARVEAGKCSPYLDTVERLATALEIPLGELCEILLKTDSTTK